jgi:putative N-acetyltransferase (TIGR04045 family)
MNTARSILSAPFAVRIARSERERHAYFALRRRIFCLEQQLFQESDRDLHDPHALPIVAVAALPGGDTRVIGVVRVYETEPGVWYGGRLGVEAAQRGLFALHRALVECAVSSAAQRGASLFLAHVQARKVPLLERLHFRVRERVQLHGLTHALMEADLARYGVPARRAREPIARCAGDAG